MGLTSFMKQERAPNAGISKQFKDHCIKCGTGIKNNQYRRKYGLLICATCGPAVASTLEGQVEVAQKAVRAFNPASSDTIVGIPLTKPRKKYVLSGKYSKKNLSIATTSNQFKALDRLPVELGGEPPKNAMKPENKALLEYVESVRGKHRYATATYDTPQEAEHREKFLRNWKHNHKEFRGKISKRGNTVIVDLDG